MLKKPVYYLLSVLLLLNYGFINAQTTNNSILTGDDPETIFNNGLKALHDGDIPQAIKLLEKLSSYNTPNPNYYIYLGYLYYVEGNYEKAINVLNKSLTYNDKILITHLLLGETYYQMNQILQARDEYKAVLNLNNDIKLAHIRMYEFYKDNNPAKANSHYLKIFLLPSTKIEKYLPDIKKIGDTANLPFNKNFILLKDINIDKKLKSDTTIINKVLGDEKQTVTSNQKSEVIVSVQKNKFKLSFNFIKNPFKNIDQEAFNVKLVELIVVSILLLIFTWFQKREERGFERVVLSQYRVSSIKKE